VVQCRQESRVSLQCIFPITLFLLAGCSTQETNMKSESRPSALHPAEMVGFLVTCDAARCRSFFVDQLGFREVSEDPFALVLEADGRMIRVQKAKTHEPRPYTVLGWNVKDIEAARNRLDAVGVRFEEFGFPGQDAHGIMTFPDGARVAWFKDPDGNTLSVAQLQ
jgi:catechol 2,3-dioxygenase-like lactoylglutathione lyase family enzyme